MGELLSILLTSVLALLEKIYDKKIQPVIDKDGRTKEENKIIHGWQLPLRGYCLSLIGTTVWFAFRLTWDHAIVIGAMSMLYYGWFFNLIVALFWLKNVKYYHDRTSHSKLNFYLKLTGVIAGYAGAWFIYGF